MRTDELDFELPPDRIAQRPVSPRDSARLMVLIGDRPPEHRHVRDLPELLEPGDALVFNTSAVIPARIVAHRATGRRVDGLALGPHGLDATGVWRVLLRGSARLRVGERLSLDPPVVASASAGETADGGAPTALRLLERLDEGWCVRFERLEGDEWHPIDGWSALATCGWTPLPPYILQARLQTRLQTRKCGSMQRDEVATGRDDVDDRRWYQTVYADTQRVGSVAAPTAGLHFTPELLERLAARGVKRIDVTLHVGEGTFRPVTAETLADHRMHAERYEVDASSRSSLRAQRGRGGRIVAVGSTSARTLESLPDGALGEAGPDGPLVGETRLLIAPPYRFRHLDGLLTNFHLPRSTLLAMVAALVGLDRLMAAYAEAIAHGYRFFSYGDAMLILPEPSRAADRGAASAVRTAGERP